MRIAVTGATGRVGGSVVARLSEHSGHVVVAVARHRPAGLPVGVEFAYGDYGDLESLRRAFDGLDTLVFVSSDGPAVDVLVHHGNVVRAARESGVHNIVALSGLDSDVASPFCYGVTYGHTERLLAESGGEVTVCRASIFAEFFAGFLSTARRRGELRLPAGDARISLVSVADVASSLAAAALHPPARRVVELTGPEALTLREVARVASRTGQRPIGYVDVDSATFLRELAADAVDPWWCYAFCSMFASVRQHRWERVSPDVGELTGRPPRSLDQVLAG